jgi:hypothetical protein
MRLLQEGRDNMLDISSPINEGRDVAKGRRLTIAASFRILENLDATNGFDYERNLEY